MWTAAAPTAKAAVCHHPWRAAWAHGLAAYTSRRPRTSAQVQAKPHHKRGIRDLPEPGFRCSCGAKLFTEEAKQRLKGACWFEAAGDMAEGISDRARYADLVILGQYEWQAPLETHPLPIAHSLSLQCGRPVLVVPTHMQPFALERVAIAWDGSREAVRAVHDALPLLRLSRSVHIVEIVSRSAENYDECHPSYSSPATWVQP